MSSGDRPTSALYGFSTLVLKLLREEQPEEVAFAVDAPGPTFRHKRYPGYKDGRGPLHPDLQAQLGELPELLSAFGFPAHRAPGFEADDLLATLVSRTEGPALIASGDRDLLQLVDDRVGVLFLGRRGKPPVRYDRSAVTERFGILPHQLPSYVAFVGDPSDNLPKVPGVGPKTATKLVAEHGSVDSILAALASLAPKLQTALRDYGDQAREVETLARLRQDAPLEEPAFAPLRADAIGRLSRLFERWEMTSLLKRTADLGDGLP